jgi:co-chaperonin GroES (HSP10)
MNDYYTNKMPIDEDTVAVNDAVIVKIIEQPNSSRKYGNIFLPTKHIENTQLIIGQIHSSGHLAKKEGMKEGELVFYDKGSAFGHPPETPGTLIVTYMENVIAKVTLKDDEVVDAIPFGDRIMVGEYQPEATEIGGIIIAENAQVRSNINTVHRIGTGNVDAKGKSTKFPVKKGDQVVVDYDKCTSLTVSEEKMYIIDLEKVLAVIQEEKPKKTATKKKTTKKKDK